MLFNGKVQTFKPSNSSFRILANFGLLSLLFQTYLEEKILWQFLLAFESNPFASEAKNGHQNLCEIYVKAIELNSLSSDGDCRDEIRIGRKKKDS